MSPPLSDDFYIGYLPKAPSGVARRVRFAVTAYILFSMIVATICVVFIARTGTGVWDIPSDGSFKTFTGTLIKSPYPIIELDSPPSPGVNRTGLLVDFGKRGAQSRVEHLSGRVRVTGTTIHRDGRAMIELAPDTDAIVELHESAILPASSSSLAPITLRGEIVDPKCFLGAMKPGEGKTHKACAIRCISGGIPPTLVTWDDAGHSTCYILTNDRGEPANSLFLNLVGEPVEVTGTLHRIGDLLIIRTNPEHVKPL